MSTDTKALLLGLIEYRRSLEKHVDQIRSNYIILKNCWQMFNVVAEGDYAEQFRSGWIQTEARFMAYLNQSQKVKELLSERIQALAELNRENSEILIQSLVKGSQLNTGFIQDGNIKIEGNSSNLRKNMGEVAGNMIPLTNIFYPEGTYEAHHVIPGESANKSPLVRAAIKAGFHIDSSVNGIYLPRTDLQKQVVQKLTGVSLPKHSGYHKIYSGMIDDILELHWKDINGQDHLSEYFVRGDVAEDERVLNTLNSAIGHWFRAMWI